MHHAGQCQWGRWVNDKMSNDTATSTTSGTTTTLATTSAPDTTWKWSDGRHGPCPCVKWLLRREGPPTESERVQKPGENVNQTAKWRPRRLQKSESAATTRPRSRLRCPTSQIRSWALSLVSSPNACSWSCTVKVSVATTANFPAIKPPKSTPFDCYQADNAVVNGDTQFAELSTLIAGETDAVDFFSSSESRQAPVGSRCVSD